MKNKSFPTALVWQVSRPWLASEEKHSLGDLLELIRAVFPWGKCSYTEAFFFGQKTLRPEIRRQFPRLATMLLTEARQNFGDRMVVTVAPTPARNPSPNNNLKK